MHCWSRNLLWLVIAILGTLNLISACGQKGPLYPPPPDKPAQSEQSPNQ
jgi:predicted small lipoprotein YifL